MQFLGTAAADCMPGPFCKCFLCQEARKDPSKGRLRSMFQLDEENLIDFGPDLCAAALRHNADLTEIKNVFLTHTHEDHFDASNIGLIRMSRTRGDLPINLYCSEEAYDTLMRKYELLKNDFPKADSINGVTNGNIILHPVKVGLTFFASGYEILPVLTTHMANKTERAVNYRFKKGNKSLLYACDTGYYISDSLELLRDSNLDILIMEGTWGNETGKSTASHMNAYAFINQLDIFYEYGIIRSDTAVYCTHINHKHGWNHDAYQQFFNESTTFNVTVALDGMKIDF